MALWGAGTIRKAQNLLKQYSQHGLDGKKASNLIPLEGNLSLPHFFFFLFSSLQRCCVCEDRMQTYSSDGVSLVWRLFESFNRTLYFWWNSWSVLKWNSLISAMQSLSLTDITSEGNVHVFESVPPPRCLYNETETPPLHWGAEVLI